MLDKDGSPICAPGPNKVLFLCHNCSDINNHSGEACSILADVSNTDQIVNGAIHCSMFCHKDQETNYYIVNSKEDKENLRKIWYYPGWGCNIYNPEDYEHFYLRLKTISQYSLELNYKALKAFKEIWDKQKIDEEPKKKEKGSNWSDYNCTLESDPILIAEKRRKNMN